MTTNAPQKRGKSQSWLRQKADKVHANRLAVPVENYANISPAIIHDLTADATRGNDSNIIVAIRDNGDRRAIGIGDRAAESDNLGAWGAAIMEEVDAQEDLSVRSPHPCGYLIEMPAAPTEVSDSLDKLFFSVWQIHGDHYTQTARQRWAKP
jgi:hypothetical protein